MKDNPNHLTVIGIGRLGICFALCLEKAGYHVLGVDLSSDYVSKINAKTFISNEPSVTEFLKNSQNLKTTTSLKEGLDFSETCFIFVPTNTIQEVQSYDHSIVSELLCTINSHAVSNKHLVICSTVFPGYIPNTARSLIKDCKNTSISYNPEFIAQGDIIKGLLNPDVVLIGEGSKAAGDRLQVIYQKFCRNTPKIARLSISSAEITKLAVNCYITAKIAFANLIGDIADETPGANKDEILKAIGQDQRIGSKNFKAGYGFGGPCFPRDNRALGNYATLVGINPLFFRSTDLTNESHAEFMANKLIQQNLDRYVFRDVCYKPHCPVPIIEHSQKLVVAKKIAEKGKEVTIVDKENIIQIVRKEYKNLFKYEIDNK
ncbi:MAG: UDP-glucose/GDP-mannose dehydrogenase isoform 1 [Parachlamydiales bacterium]|nr:UDP-glucose/GDP-mannose dehydrogenase isoform 1 [Parachlamydiales bacterium]